MDPIVVFSRNVATIKTPVNFCDVNMASHYPVQNVMLQCNFRNLYDFSRKAGSLLRLCMLEASGMKAYHNPKFSTKLPNMGYIQPHVSPSVPGYLPPCVVPQYLPPSVQPKRIDMAHGDARRAKRLAAEFDRLFPHFLIECDLEDCMPQLKLPNLGIIQATIPGHMYVIYFDEGIIYRIDASIDVMSCVWTVDNTIMIDAGVCVSVQKYSFCGPEVSFFIYENGFTKFKSVTKPVIPYLKSECR
ncbi:Hypothetical predicted protein [Paramuricea clavata]|uniref:Uncharacterized protein n=1 Tax=Paramuricea clavata TaxID=317549 RepID=A0A7D9ECN6_PARCT|nr:Hypothetical predicted protein [Paramuricea clavata]